MRRLVMRLFWLGVFGLVLSLTGLCGSSGSDNPPAPLPPTKQRPAATYTASAPVVKTGYQGGQMFGENISQVASYLNDECYMAFEWEEGGYQDFYLMEGFGVSLDSDSGTLTGSTEAIGFLMDFTGDLIDEPNADMLTSISACMTEETGVPFDSLFQWAYDNAESIFLKGEEGYFDTVMGYFVGGFFEDELMTIVVTDWS